ncbi:MAG: 30S ribosomal protein S20 [Candidatus Wildermuthbacteria bacterium]|nr:30S ribosomal protein S20 [Candidatus Wildermuthbacteria bacterium]
MPITKSAKKALRQSERRRVHNLKTRREVKEAIKKMKSLIAKKNYEEAKTFAPHLYQILDKAAKLGVIKKNTASRNKSRLSHFPAKSV